MRSNSGARVYDAAGGRIVWDVVFTPDGSMAIRHDRRRDQISKSPVLRKYPIPLGLAVTTGSRPIAVAHERMVSLLRIAGLLVEDAFRWVLLLFRSAEALRAENLFLRRQLALYIERGVQPRRIDAATRVSLALLARLFD